jgi:hypothetical protein
MLEARDPWGERGIADPLVACLLGTKIIHGRFIAKMGGLARRRWSCISQGSLAYASVIYSSCYRC